MISTPISASMVYTATETGHKLPQKQPSQLEDALQPVVSEPDKTINMRNISMTEINQLIRSGVDGGLLDRLPINAIFDGNGQYQRGAGGYQSDQKIDMIANIEKTINFKQSLGESVELENEILTKYKQLDGTTFPKSINEIS